MSHLGPLTTTFTPPASCSDSTGIIQVRTVNEDDSSRPSVITQVSQGPLQIGDCFPTNYEPIRGNYYSPGVCPSGYDVACTGISDAFANDIVVTCCPT